MFKGKNVYLCPYEKEDALKLAKLMNNYDLIKCLGPGQLTVYSTEDGLEWFEANRKNKESRFSFAIKTIDGDRYIGGVGYHNLDRKNGHAELGIMIAEPDLQNKGYGTEATRLFLDYAFLEMNLHKVYLNVYDFNKRAIAVYEKVGFKVEGYRKEHTYREGRYADDIIMAIFKNEYIPLYRSKNQSC